MQYQEVTEKLISFDCFEYKNKCPVSRGCGTAFWADISGNVKLITAAHIPWPAQSARPENGEKLLVKWKMTSGSSGEGEAVFYPHPTNSEIDYASISFCNESNIPPMFPFPIAKTNVCKDDAIVSFGFPGPYTQAQADSTTAIVDEVEDSGQRILVAGRACGGYSGGPSFQFCEEGTVKNEVIGLMSGAPSPQIIEKRKLGDAYVLVSALKFE